MPTRAVRASVIEGRLHGSTRPVGGPVTAATDPSASLAEATDAGRLKESTARTTAPWLAQGSRASPRSLDPRRAPRHNDSGQGQAGTGSLVSTSTQSNVLVTAFFHWRYSLSR